MEKVYARAILVDLFWKSNYVNLLSIFLCTMLVSNLGIFFLCYPNPRVPVYLRKLVRNSTCSQYTNPGLTMFGLLRQRWIGIVIPELVLLIAHMDHVRLIYKIPSFERQLENTSTSSTLILHTQLFVRDHLETGIKCLFKR
jgi:hypothetical protein